MPELIDIQGEEYATSRREAIARARQLSGVDVLPDDIEQQIGVPTTSSGDLRGMGFYKLKCIAYALSEHHHSRWICRCECGTYVTKRRQNLTDGRSKSCGCTKARVPPEVRLTISQERLSARVTKINRDTQQQVSRLESRIKALDAKLTSEIQRKQQQEDFSSAWPENAPRIVKKSGTKRQDIGWALEHLGDHRNDLRPPTKRAWGLWVLAHKSPHNFSGIVRTMFGEPKKDKVAPTPTGTNDEQQPEDAKEDDKKESWESLIGGYT